MHEIKNVFIVFCFLTVKIYTFGILKVHTNKVPS